MIGAFWILIFTIAVGIVLYVFELRWRRRHSDAAAAKMSEAAEANESAEVEETQSGSEEPGKPAAQEPAENTECCGLHLVCEKDSLSPMSDEIIYYDDEELDRFIGRDPNSYSADETEEFRDVLMTLRPEDVTGWARSVTQRRLELPPDVRDELLMLVNEQRQTR